MLRVQLSTYVASNYPQLNTNYCFCSTEDKTKDQRGSQKSHSPPRGATGWEFKLVFLSPGLEPGSEAALPPPSLLFLLGVGLPPSMLIFLLLSGGQSYQPPAHGGLGPTSPLHAADLVPPAPCAQSLQECLSQAQMLDFIHVALSGGCVPAQRSAFWLQGSLARVVCTNHFLAPQQQPTVAFGDLVSGEPVAMRLSCFRDTPAVFLRGAWGRSHRPGGPPGNGKSVCSASPGCLMSRRGFGRSFLLAKGHRDAHLCSAPRRQRLSAASGASV